MSSTNIQESLLVHLHQRVLDMESKWSQMQTQIQKLEVKQTDLEQKVTQYLYSNNDCSGIAPLASSSSAEECDTKPTPGITHSDVGLISHEMNVRAQQLDERIKTLEAVCRLITGEANSGTQPDTTNANPSEQSPLIVAVAGSVESCKIESVDIQAQGEFEEEEEPELILGELDPEYSDPPRGNSSSNFGPIINQSRLFVTRRLPLELDEEPVYFQDAQDKRAKVAKMKDGRFRCLNCKSESRFKFLCHIKYHYNSRHVVGIGSSGMH